MRHRNISVAAIPGLVCLISAVIALPGAAAPSPATRQLRVGLYPYVPDAQRLFLEAKRAFEHDHPEVEVIPADLDNYYDSKKPNSALKTTADVIELDSVFMPDAIASLIQPLPSSISVVASDYFPAAVELARQTGTWYGVPHWLCSNFLFVATGPRERPRTLSLKNLEALIGTHHKPGTGILLDLKGKSTLGELFADALLDNADSPAEIDAYLANEDLKAKAEASLQRALDLCDQSYCRSSALHEETGSYAHLFAHRQAMAFAGYSEELYYLLHELRDRCTPGPCLRVNEIAILPLTLSDKRNRPLVWVDTLAIARTCTGQCLDDAAAFIVMMTSDPHLLADLLPEGDVPRYLLPAKITLNQRLDVEARLYPQLRAIIAAAVPVASRTPALADRLRAIGADLDSRLKH